MLIGMEACSGAHYWARRVREYGHEVKLMAPQFVTPYRKANKNDHIPSDLVVAQCVSDGESRLQRDVLLLPDVWTTSNRLSGHKITSIISVA